MKSDSQCDSLRFFQRASRRHWTTRVIIFADISLAISLSFIFFSVYLSFRFFVFVGFSYSSLPAICVILICNQLCTIYVIRGEKNMPRRRRTQRVLRVFGGGNIPEIYTWCERSLDKSYNTHLLLFCCVFGTFACFWYS